VDLHGTPTRAAASRVANYLPTPLAAVRGWLARAVQAGTTPRAPVARGDERAVVLFRRGERRLKSNCGGGRG
jgi:hypothetical protein